MNENLKQWLTENAMGRMFQLSELNRQTGVYFNVVGNVVTFNARNSQHPIAKELDGKILYLDTFEEVPSFYQNNLTAQVEEKQEEESEVVDVDKDDNEVDV